MDVKEKIQAQISAAQQEFRDLTRKIEGCEPGPVRQELRRRRHGLTATMNDLRQELIAIELKSDNPQNVPRVSFAG